MLSQHKSLAGVASVPDVFGTHLADLSARFEGISRSSPMNAGCAIFLESVGYWSIASGALFPALTFV